MDYHNNITIEPGKLSGMTEAEILEDFSGLTSEDIKACLAFAADREKKLFVSSL